MSQESALAPAVTAMHVAQVENSMHDVVEARMKATVDELGPIGNSYVQTATEQSYAPANGPSEGKTLDLGKLRIATQARELIIQGVTLRNTFKEFNEVWLELYTADKQCIIVDQVATKLKYQLVNLYAIKLIKYLNSIIGLDMVPLAQQDPQTRTWKMDAVILNIASNKVNDHEHLFRLMVVNLFGVSEDVIDYALAPTWLKLHKYLEKTYGVVTPEVVRDAEPTIEDLDKIISIYLATGDLFIG